MTSRSGKLGFSAAASVVVIGAVLLSGCGSKPAFCQKEDELNSAVKQLGNAITSVNPTQIQTAGQNVQTDANALVTSAQNTYPGQTQEIQTSVTELVDGVKSFSSSTDKVAAAAGLVADLTAVKTAFQGLQKKTKSDCG